MIKQIVLKILFSCMGAIFNKSIYFHWMYLFIKPLDMINHHLLIYLICSVASDAILIENWYSLFMCTNEKQLMKVVGIVNCNWILLLVWGVDGDRDRGKNQHQCLLGLLSTQSRIPIKRESTLARSSWALPPSFLLHSLVSGDYNYDVPIKRCY